MTTQTAPTSTSILPANLSPSDLVKPTPVKTFAQLVVEKTIARTSARISLVWIGILAFLAIFAPLIANSHPYLIRLNGHWSSPLLGSLGALDLCLIYGFFAVIVLLGIKNLRTKSRLLIVFGGMAGVYFLVWLLHPPAVNIVYSRYREAEAAGDVSFVLRAPIPFSALDRSDDQRFIRHVPPSKQHLLGTEEYGGDVFSRLLHACRVAMSIGFISTGIAISIGVVVGGLMGYFAGMFDMLGMRLIEIFEAIPTLFLMITLVAFFPGESYRFPMLMVIIGVTSWTGYARYLRAEFLRLRNQDFVQAAIASGLPTSSVIFKHILPNGIAPVVISASFSIAGAIVSESTLSYLHLGVMDQPSWGGMLSQSLGQGGDFHWWLAVFPGIAIFLTVFSYNMLGEALADALDPKRT